jgi:hypothetical protein
VVTTREREAERQAEDHDHHGDQREVRDRQFPISSLGHTVLVSSWFGGTWATLVCQESSAESPYLAFIVGLHFATAIVLVGFYAKE